MSERDGRVTFDGVEPAREYRNVALVACCALAVVLATVLVPIAATVETGGSPAESLVPIPGAYGGSSDAAPAGSASSVPGASGDRLGALNAGQQASVGGSIASNGSAFQSQSADVHFVVESPEPAYWRTGAYDTYTGGGWEQSGTSDASAPVEGSQLRYRVELRKSAQSLPSVWRPIGVEETDAASVTDGGLLRSDQSLPAGTSFVGVSQRPPRDEDLLRASGRSYPDDVEARYTALPDETRERLGPFTDELTADADSPYETAVAIEQWLESNKSYSLNVSEPPSDDVASQFVFEMDAGYCEYFATSMVAMLRTQGVPARYVVGYSTGQQVDASTYRVREMNAHAWVEAYFEGVGWVRFDPTPGQERLQQERESFQEQNAQGEYAPREEGSPGEQFTPTNATQNGSTPTDAQSPTDVPTETETDSTPTETTPGGPTQTPPDDGEPRESDDPNDSPYSVELNRTAVPGAPVEVTVTRDRLPVVGADVHFNDEFVGVTGPNGTVAGTVPYDENLTISVEGGRTYTGGGARALAAGPASVGSPPIAAQQDNATRSVDVATDANLTVTGDAITGSEVVVTATVDGVPVRDAVVTLNGTRVGTTDGDGRIRVALPETPGNVTVAVERHPISGSRTIELRELDVSVDPAWPLPLAGTPVEVTATLGDEPAAGATVTVDGTQVGETGVNGTYTATLPPSSSVDVSVAAAGQTAEQSIENPRLNLVAATLALMALVAGAAVAVVRRGGPRRALALARRGFVGGYRALVRGVVGLGLAIERGAARAVERAQLVAEALAGVLAGRQSLADLANAFRTWLRERLDRGRSVARSAGRSGPGAADPASTDQSSTEARLTLREAWRRFVRHVSVRRPRTKTPGQLAAHAVSADDLPRDAVLALRDEFRAVEYGPRSADSALPTVEEAIERIEAAARGESPEETDAEARDD